MDVIAGSGLEPQLAIPVIFVVVGAVLVYMFGFQKTEEPSYEHLAILQSSSSYKNRSVNVKHHNGAAGGGSNKASGGTATAKSNKANGHVVSNGSVASGSKSQQQDRVNAATKTENKEVNKAPQVKASKAQQAVTKKDKASKGPANKPEDFESGDWIQATSRKDKKKKSPTQAEAPVAPGSPVKETVNIGKRSGGAEEPKQQQQKSPIIIVDEGEQEIPASVLKELEAVIQKQNHSTQTSPEKRAAAAAGVVAPNQKASKGTATSTPASSAQSSPVKKPQAEVKPVVQDKKKVEEVEVKEEPAAKEKEVNPKSNIAFDEMGDSWEEAKSRGAKKRRARRE